MSGALPIRQVSARVVERVYGGALGVPISLTITQDESWSPRVQGELTAPRRLLDQIERPNDSAALGKLQGDLLTIKLATRYGRQRTCADYTKAMQGVSYAWSGAPDASQSIKKIAGVEVARNYAINPIPASATYYSGVNNAVVTFAGDALDVQCAAGVTVDSGLEISTAISTLPLGAFVVAVDLESVNGGEFRFSYQGTWVWPANQNSPYFEFAPGERRTIYFAGNRTAISTVSAYILSGNLDGNEHFKVRSVGAYVGNVPPVFFHGSMQSDLMSLARTPPIPWHPGEPIMPLSAATARWGASVAAVTAECGGSVAAITRALRQPGGAYDVPPTELRTVRVRRRKETPTDLEGTVTITLAGEDVRLHDARNTATAAYVNYYTSLRALVTDVLGKVYEYSLDIDRPKLTPGATVAITTGQEWKPAASAWEFLHPILEAAGWQLYADLAGVYQLEARIATPAPHGLDASVDLIDFVPVRDRTDGYYTAAMVEYTDGNPAIPAERWDVYAPAGSHRVAHETRPGKRLSAGAAEQIVARARARATPGTAQSTVQLDLLPGHRLPIRTPWRTEQATISALTHTYPAAETRYELRDIPTE